MFWKAAILFVLGLANLGLAFKMIWGPTGFVECRELKARHMELKERIASLDAENVALSRDIRLMQSDPQYVEKMVRQKLHYLRDNEVVYIFAKPASKTDAEGHDGKN